MREIGVPRPPLLMARIVVMAAQTRLIRPNAFTSETRAMAKTMTTLLRLEVIWSRVRDQCAATARAREPRSELLFYLFHEARSALVVNADMVKVHSRFPIVYVAVSDQLAS